MEKEVGVGEYGSWQAGKREKEKVEWLDQANDVGFEIVVWGYHVRHGGLVLGRMRPGEAETNLVEMVADRGEPMAADSERWCGCWYCAV